MTPEQKAEVRSVLDATSSEEIPTLESLDGVPEAPINGTTYARKNGAWTEAQGLFRPVIFNPSGLYIADVYTFLGFDTYQGVFPTVFVAGELTYFYATSCDSFDGTNFQNLASLEIHGIVASVFVGNNAALLSLDLTGAALQAYPDTFHPNAMLNYYDVTGSEGNFTTVVLPASLDTFSASSFNHNYLPSFVECTMVTVELNNATVEGAAPLDFTDSLNLSYLDLGSGALTQMPILDGCVALAAFYANENTYVAADVDAMFILLESFGLSNGVIDLSGGGSDPPTAASATARADLASRGYTITHN